ncbi:hypothetical protein Asp14428_39560 [Actinoplanes sp. NBRC 14428]|nr:hypothetical protein Asp14428_39560 [Actinoplanes sp. NBRC 14428]
MRLGRIGGALAVLILAAAPASPAAAQGTYPPGITAGTLALATSGPAVVAAGGAESCTITSVGDAYCWGPSGRPVVRLRNAVQLAAGPARTCAIDARGDAYCWGAESAPRRVPGLTGRTLVDIAAGDRHTCALDDEGSAWCWGDGSRGQLGVPGTGRSATPVRVGGLTGPVVDLAAGGDTTCAATAGGVAYCWGAGVPGGERKRPTALRTDGKVRQVAVGSRGQCALATDGEATCWDPKASSTGPLAGISVGAGHVCGLRRDGRAWCRGDGVAAPVDVGAPLVALDAGIGRTCAVDTVGYVYCWGLSGVPMRVEGLPRAPASATGVRVRALDGGLRVSWTPPADLGSGQFEYVWATTAGHESGCALSVLTATGCELRNLHNGRAYDVAVVVKTSDGVTVSDYVTGAPAAIAPEPAELTSAVPRVLPPDAGGGLPVTGLSPAALIAIGTMLLGGGLVALLVRKP